MLSGYLGIEILDTCSKISIFNTVKWFTWDRWKLWKQNHMKILEHKIKLLKSSIIGINIAKESISELYYIA